MRRNVAEVWLARSSTVQSKGKTLATRTFVFVCVGLKRLLVRCGSGKSKARYFSQERGRRKVGKGWKKKSGGEA